MYTYTYTYRQFIIANPSTSMFFFVCFLDERKPENPKETDRDTGRTCKTLHRHKSKLGSNQGPWNCEEAMLLVTTVLSSDNTAINFATTQ